MICAHCGSEIPEDVLFCTKCGEPVEKLDAETTEPLETVKIENPIFCQHCGAKLPEDAAFCSQCGKPVKEASGHDITETMATVAAAPLTTAANATAPMPESLVQEKSKAADNSAAESDTSPSKKANKASNHTRILVIIIIVLVVLLLMLAFFLFDPFGIMLSDEVTDDTTAVEEVATSENDATVPDADESATNEEENDDGDAADTQDEEEFPGEVQKAIDGETSADDTDIQAAMASPYGYIWNSDSGYMSASAKSALGNLTDVELCLARNEIFARHGRMFDTDWIQQYFDSKDWYEPEYTPEEFDALSDPLNKYEKVNLENIEEVEKSRNSPYIN